MIEWGTVYWLEADLLDPSGDPNQLALNATTGYRYLLKQSECKATRTLRVTNDRVPQGDGEIIHRRFADGTVVHVVIEFWNNNETACVGTAAGREMHETLVQFLNAMLNRDGRLYWAPSDYSDNRMLDKARYLAPLETVIDDSGAISVEFDIDSPYPYTLDVTQPDSPGGIVCPNSVPTVITMSGNVDFYPVIKCDGPLSTFSVENLAIKDDDGDALGIFYDETRPGAIAIPGGSYIEFETFRNTAYLNGDQTNMKPGVDPELTDYFVLKPGENIILATGCDARLLVNTAWAVA